MADCEFLQGCPIFNKFKSEGLANLWIKKFCKANPDSCQRKQMRNSGEKPDPRMLPNGSYLSSLE